MSTSNQASALWGLAGAPVSLGGMADKLLIFEKMYDLNLTVYPMVTRLPKSYRPVLGKTIEELMIGCLVAITQANQARGEVRVELQRQLSTDLDSLRIVLRLTKDLRLISIKQYTVLAQKVNEIGRMLGSWRRAEYAND